MELTMPRDRWVLGVLGCSPQVGDPIVAKKYRDITISWTRYDYRGQIIESDDLQELLRRAQRQGYAWCFVLPVGKVIVETWTLDDRQSRGLYAEMKELMERQDFVIAAPLQEGLQTWDELVGHPLLVNLERFAESGHSLVPGGNPSPCQESPLVQRGSGLDFLVNFDPQRAGWMLDLAANSPRHTAAFAKFLGTGIASFDRAAPDPELSPGQAAFLTMVQPQTERARHGVFLWNIEDYSDIESPPSDSYSPIQSLYSVAAGFKPNRILHTHGWDHRTRVIFFDYSRRALDVRRYMIEHWDGRDFPNFLPKLFERFPHPATFYQLWGDRTPDNVSPKEIEWMWNRELARWGGPQGFFRHWQAYRQLEHVFIECDLLGDSRELFAQIKPEANALIWWSNAFFTFFGNWFYDLEERRRTYEAWMKRIAELNPQLQLLGSDYNNVSVNSIRAEVYWTTYLQVAGDCLSPCRVAKTELRM